MPADFFAGLPNEGEAIKAPAARQLTKNKRLVFMNNSSSFDFLVRAVPKHSESPRWTCPELNLGDCRDLPLFRDCTVSRMRREHTIAAGQPPAMASIIIGQNDEMRCGFSVFCSDVASGLRDTTRTQYESVTAIRDLWDGREGARRHIWPG
jgi:hypothetical protein